MTRSIKVMEIGVVSRMQQRPVRVVMPSRPTTTDSRRASIESRSATPSQIQVSVQVGTRWDLCVPLQEAQVTTSPQEDPSGLYKNGSFSCPNLSSKTVINYLYARKTSTVEDGLVDVLAGTGGDMARPPHSAGASFPLSWSANFCSSRQVDRFGTFIPAGESRPSSRTSTTSGTVDAASTLGQEVPVEVLLSRRDSRKFQDLLLLPTSKSGAYLKVPTPTSCSSNTSSPTNPFTPFSSSSSCSSSSVGLCPQPNHSPSSPTSSFLAANESHKGLPASSHQVQHQHHHHCHQQQQLQQQQQQQKLYSQQTHQETRQADRPLPVSPHKTPQTILELQKLSLNNDQLNELVNGGYRPSSHHRPSEGLLKADRTNELCSSDSRPKNHLLHHEVLENGESVCPDVLLDVDREFENVIGYECTNAHQTQFEPNKVGVHKAPLKPSRPKDSSILAFEDSVGALDQETGGTFPRDLQGKETCLSSGGPLCNAGTLLESAQETRPSQRKYFNNDTICQILEHLYMGTIEAAYCEPVLCKLDITCVVDISNTRPSEVPAAKKTICPCTCPLETAHLRSRLCINIPDSLEEDILPYLDDVNRFINGSRTKKKNVLVHSYLGNSRAPAFIVQYLIQNNGMNLKEAHTLVKTARPSTSINSTFMRTLQRVERGFCPGRPTPLLQVGAKGSTALPQTRRSAWS